MALVVAVTIAMIGPSVAAPSDGAGWVSRFLAAVDAALETASTARRLPYKEATPRRIAFSPRRIGTVAAGADILDVATIARRGLPAWLAVLTLEEVIVLERGPRGFAERQRWRLPELRAAVVSRDPVGIIVTTDLDEDGIDELVVRTSSAASAAVVHLDRNEIEVLPATTMMQVCARVRLPLVSGRNVFDGAQVQWADSADRMLLAPWLAQLRCARGLSSPEGVPYRAIAAVDHKGEATIAVRRRCELMAGPCEAGMFQAKVEGVGYAFAVADPDGDGMVDFIGSSNTPRGEADRLQVVAISETGNRLRFERAFHGGIVGIAVGQFVATGFPEVVVAVRLAGSTRLDLWGLE